VRGGSPRSCPGGCPAGLYGDEAPAAFEWAISG
jgi:hypothetical protein